MVVTFYPQPQQGWQCPVCRRVHGPHVMTCPYCLPPLTTPAPHTSGCPRCGNPIQGKCSLVFCPNYGTTS